MRTDSSAEQTRQEAYDAAYAKAHEEGVAIGIRDQRARLTAIINSEAFTGREAVAQTLMFESDMPAAAVISLLETFSKAEAPTLPGERSKDARGGLVIAGEDAAGDFAKGQAIARSMR